MINASAVKLMRSLTASAAPAQGQPVFPRHVPLGLLTLAHLRWRNVNACQRDALAAGRKHHARIRSERHPPGGPPRCRGL